MNRFLIAVFFFAFTGCGSEGPARVLGTLQASLGWEGEWPSEGLVMAALFKTPPWDPAFVPGPPTAYSLLQEPPDATLVFRLASPGVPFGTYGGFMVAWQDPTAVESSKRMLPVSVFGATLDALSAARPIVLSADEPDQQVEFPAITLFASGDEMRSHYHPVSRE